MRTAWLNALARRFRTGPADGSADAARARVEACLRDEIGPALEAVRDRLRAEGHDPVLEQEGGQARLAVTNFNGLPLEYVATVHVYKQPVVNLASVEGTRGGADLEHFGRIAITAGGRRREYDPARCDRHAIERAARKYYRRFLMDTPRG